MKKIIFLGSGAVASEVISYLTDIQKKDPQSTFDVLGFLDDSYENYLTKSNDYGFTAPYLGTISGHKFSEDFHYVFGFAGPSAKHSIIEEVDLSRISFPNIIHPSVIKDSSAKLGVGNIIYPHSVIGPNVQIGNFNLVTSYSFISHDCRIGDYNFFSTAGLSGNVNVGSSNFFGIRSTVIPGVTIGSHNTIQAGMLVDKNVTDNETVFYRFKEKVTVIKSKE